MRLLTTDTKTADIPMVFGTHHLFRGNSTEFQWQTSFAMQGMSPCPPTLPPQESEMWLTAACSLLGLLCDQLIG